MSDHRLIHVTLDQRRQKPLSVQIEQERRIAIFDLLEGNSFAPTRLHQDAYSGPYRLTLRTEDAKLAFEIYREDESHLETIILAITSFRRIIQDYWMICNSYFDTVHKASQQQLETVDMARRGVHNQAAEMLKDRLEGKVNVDLATARRLFTLISILHIRA